MGLLTKRRIPTLFIGPWFSVPSKNFGAPRKRLRKMDYPTGSIGRGFEILSALSGCRESRGILLTSNLSLRRHFCPSVPGPEIQDI